MQNDLFGRCPYVTAQKLLTGKWTLLIMHYLDGGTRRFSEMRRLMPELCEATLVRQLRSIEASGLIVRVVYNQVPPKVEYSLSELGKKFSPVLAALETWGNEYIRWMDSQGEKPSAR